MSAPDFTSLREGRAECPSDLALDRLHAGELPESEAAALQAHIEGCAECAKRLATRRAGFAAFAEADPVRMLAAIRRGVDEPPGFLERFARPLRFAFAPIAAVAAAAGLLLVVSGPDDETTREKGTLALHVYRFTAGGSEAVVSGERFYAGDRLRFVVDLPRAGYASVLGVEPDGELYTAWPRGGQGTASLPAGAGQQLPGAVSLDESAGREMLYLVVCRSDVAPLRCASRGPGAEPTCPEGCTMTPFAMEKVETE
jgi:hypothetical protein